MQSDPNMETRIIEQIDAPDHFDGRMTGHDGMVVVSVRRTKQRNQAVAALLADNAPVAAHRRAHGNQRRFAI